jgi:hypothetical protein
MTAAVQARNHQNGRTQTKSLFFCSAIVPCKGDNTNAFEIPQTLIDTGSEINLIPRSTAEALDYPIHLSTNMAMKTADGVSKQLMEQIDIPVQVAGVEVLITAYVTEDGHVFGLLLGSDWVETVHGLMDYHHDAFIIFEEDGIPHDVHNTARPIVLSEAEKLSLQELEEKKLPLYTLVDGDTESLKAWKARANMPARLKAMANMLYEGAFKWEQQQYSTMPMDSGKESWSALGSKVDQDL